jgi:hypothetical protein
MPRYDSNNIRIKKKLTPTKAIRKFVIIQDIKTNGKTPIYYAWNCDKQPVWIQGEQGFYPEEPYFTVDYDKKTREWNIGYIISADNRKFASIDDMTGKYNILNII